MSSFLMCSLCVPLSVGLVPALRQGVVSCVLSVCPCLLDLCLHYVGGGGSSCVLSVCPLSVGLVPALRQGVVSVFSLCAPVC